ncbi:MAG: hypothetical protein K5778_00915 [Bacteroidaceae bacterium]|nr:hypothetical protein [Bacteroidaceae bacterium]
MRKNYVAPCIQLEQTECIGHLMGASGNLHEMERGSANIFGSVDDWDESKARKSNSEEGDYGSLW